MTDFMQSKKIREIDPDSKIIIVTGDITTNESNLLDSHKIDAVIYKPFDMNMVKQAITDAVLR